MKRNEPTLVQKAIDTVEGFDGVYKALYRQTVLRGQSKRIKNNKKVNFLHPSSRRPQGGGPPPAIRSTLANITCQRYAQRQPGTLLNHCKTPAKRFIKFSVIR